MKKQLKPIEKTDLSQMTGLDEHDQTYQQMTSDDPISDVIATKAINELLNLKKLKTISRVKMEQVPQLTKLYLASDVFKCDYPKKIADLIMQIQISTYGLGRKELVQVTQRQDLSQFMDQKKQNKDIFR